MSAVQLTSRLALFMSGFLVASSSCSGKSAQERACEKMVSITEGTVSAAKCNEKMSKAASELGKAKSQQLYECVAKVESKEGIKACLTAAAPEELNNYINKSKSSEAFQYLRRMGDAARTYYYAPMAQGSANMLNPVSGHALPPSVGPTPAKGACCGEDNQCAANREQWETPGWQALDFAISSPHYFSYEFIRATDGKSFEALAYGDLDCDGEFSTFAVKGTLVGDEIQLGEFEMTNPSE